MEKRTLNGTDAEEYLGISRPTFYRLCQRADFPVIRVGRAIRVPVAALERWLERNEGKQVL